MTTQRPVKDIDYQTLQPDGTFDLSFIEITDPKRIALERILRAWMAEKDQQLKSRKGGERLQERFNLLIDQGSIADVLSDEACHVTNVSLVNIIPKRHHPKNIELDTTISLRSGEIFRNLIRMHDGKVFPVELEVGAKLLSGPKEHEVMSSAGALIDKLMRQTGTYPFDVQPALTTTMCECRKANIEIAAKRDSHLEAVLENVKAVYLVTYKCAKGCGIADKNRQWAIPLG